MNGLRTELRTPFGRLPRCAPVPFSRSGHITADKRKFARLANFPNYPLWSQLRLSAERYRQFIFFL